MRYLPLTATDRAAMLGVIGVDSIDALFADVPETARLDRPVDLPKAMGEIEVERLISGMAARNIAAGSVPRRRLRLLSGTSRRERSST